jgi:tRNA(Ile)-lysidine synthase
MGLETKTILTWMSLNGLGPKDKLLVALSGGVDSVVLVHVLNSMGFQCVAGHVNFQLRGAESDGDESFVLDYCEKMGVPCFSTRVSIARLAANSGNSIQMEARNFRYGWLRDLAEKEGCSFIATAHHLNDSLETLLLNVARGTGVRGLVIPERAGVFIRPLTHCSRDEIMSYAKLNQLTWREDSSNSKKEYQRNFVRYKLIPQLEELNPALLSTFRHTQRRLAGTVALLEKHVNEVKTGYLSKINGRWNLAMGWFEGSDADLVVLSELLRPFGFGFHQVFEIGNSAASGRKFFSFTHLLYTDRDRLIIELRDSQLPDPMEIPEGQTEALWGGWHFRLVAAPPPKEFLKEPNVAWFDLDKLSFPLTIRSWEEGDRFQPLGMTGKKMLSDFMIDRKIPLTLKKHIPVVVSAGEIVWVAGHQLDDRFKIRTETKRAMCMTLTNYA